jgi:hypothetical protein
MEKGGKKRIEIKMEDTVKSQECTTTIIPLSPAETTNKQSSLF